MRPALRRLLAMPDILRGRCALMGMFPGVIPSVTGVLSATGNAQHSSDVTGLQKRSWRRPSGRGRTKFAIAPTRNIASECGTMRLLGGDVYRQRQDVSRDVRRGGAGESAIQKNFNSTGKPNGLVVRPDVAGSPGPSPTMMSSAYSRLNEADVP